MKKITQIAFVFILILALASCKNTKQKIQEHVSNYNTTASIKGGNVVSTSAKAFLNDSKIEIRIETDLEGTEENKLAYQETFPSLLAEMIKNDQISRELIEEGVKFDVYFISYNNVILAKQLVDKEELAALEGSESAGNGKETAKL
ncbi:hypothetical protein [Flavobacterium denitrificans]|uniref:hypothetical protein n=1 Tax=Flavobacterium denitrificans TaxID=281361 RepID=UPI00042556B9|nr:hypothetical protein [Flavobacterium denitrificans]